MALITGFIVTMAMLGGVVAQAPMTELVMAVGWRHALQINATVGLGIVFIIWLVVYDCPPGTEAHFANRQNELEALGLLPSILKVMKNLSNWLYGIYTCLLNLPLIIFGAVWGAMFLTQVHHFSRMDASEITSMVFLGTIVGSPAFGWLSDKISRRRLPMIFGAIASIILVTTILYWAHPSFWQYMILFFALGFFTSTQVLSYPAIAESNPPALTGTAVGLSAVMIMSGGVFAPVFGWLLELHWDGKIVQGVSQYSVANYHTALLLLPASFAVGLLAVLLTRETNA